MANCEAARRHDSSDPLTDYAERYRTEGLVHLNGNSLGPALIDLDDRLAEVTATWASRQIGGWFGDGWLSLPRTVGDKIAGLVGATPGSIVVPGESTSTVLFNALIAALRMGADGRVEGCANELLVEEEAFPTDHYMAASTARMFGCNVVTVPADDLPETVTAHGARVAAVLTSPVDFRTGHRRDIAALTRVCRASGAVSVVDLSHAAGVLPVELDAWGVDLAVGCGYKYLGGGPGAPAFLYVAPRRRDTVDLPLTGWHGHAEPFIMSATFRPAESIDRGRIGTPQVLSLVALDHALTPLVEVGTAELHRRSVDLATTFIDVLTERRPDLAERIVTPIDPSRRGAHLALRHEDADQAERILFERNVLVDSRGPDLLRVAFSPLILTHEQVYSAARIIEDVLEVA
ncbi:aminotransferase class V-fold PLP-dependent enzyme [Dermacoccus sp. 147Ba]|nr:kynureninase [Dermacoccus sp. PE3]RYI20633.1 aminotransferase class V-fold PLP-dependent enzyme [Dermacoccus sp. 147Ba]